VTSQGHAEVVQVALSDEDQSAQQEFKKFADTYFSQFQKGPRGRGMMRLDPQDSGEYLDNSMIS
jgi:coproporphyrinogen III oxidase